jgi:oligosaccharide 4-alpha-D-glucosyltransferase
MFGNNLLIAPVTNKGQETINVYLPKGRWYSLWDNKLYEGFKKHSLDVTIETIPIFIKEGSIIPMVKPVNSTDNYSSKNLTLKYYAGQPADSSYFNMFEDDGKTYGSVGRGEFEYLRFKAKHTEDGTILIEMLRDGWDYEGMPKTRTIKLHLIGNLFNEKSKIGLDGKKLKSTKKEGKFPSYNMVDGELIVTFEWDGSYRLIDVRN